MKTPTPPTSDTIARDNAEWAAVYEPLHALIYELFDAHCPHGKWITGPHTLISSIATELATRELSAREIAAQPREGEIAHTTEDDYQHFLSYSGLDHSPLLRYAYYHGADVGLDKPTGGNGGGLPLPVDHKEDGSGRLSHDTLAWFQKAVTGRSHPYIDEIIEALRVRAESHVADALDGERLDFLDSPFVAVIGCEPDVPTVQVIVDRYGSAREYSGPNIRAATDAAIAARAEAGGES